MLGPDFQAAQASFKSAVEQEYAALQQSGHDRAAATHILLQRIAQTDSAEAPKEEVDEIMHGFRLSREHATQVVVVKRQVHKLQQAGQSPVQAYQHLTQLVQPAGPRPTSASAASVSISALGDSGYDESKDQVAQFQADSSDENSLLLSIQSHADEDILLEDPDAAAAAAKAAFFDADDTESAGAHRATKRSPDAGAIDAHSNKSARKRQRGPTAAHP